MNCKNCERLYKEIQGRHEYIRSLLAEKRDLIQLKNELEKAIEILDKKRMWLD